MKKENRFELAAMPMDKMFIINGNAEMCHSTGYEIVIENDTWNEYIDSIGDIHYAR